MKAAYLRKLDDLAHVPELHRSWIRCVLRERQVRSRGVVVVDVGAKNPTQVIFVENDQVVETLSPEGADPALGERILPGAPRGCDHLGDAHGLHRGAEVNTVDAVPVTH